MPERHRAGHARRRGDDHPVTGDLLDAPRGGAQQERLPRARLVDHLLVQLAHPAAVGQIDAEEAAVRDGPGIGDRERPRPGARTDRAGDPVPHDPRTQLGELRRGIPAVQHVEHVVELPSLEIGVGPGALEQGVELVDGHALLPGARGDGDHLLRQHVERIARHDGGLDEPLAHAPRHDGALEQVGAELGEDAAARDLSHAVAGAADALQSARDRLGRLDLDHQVDGAHVDAELKRGRGDQARQLPRLEQVLDDDALLARERPVVGTGDLARALPRRLGLLGGEVVETQGDALGGPAVVDEHERRPVLAHESQKLRVDRRPDAAPRGLAPARERLELERHVGLDHGLHGDVDAQVQRLADACVDHRALARRADQVARDLLERMLRGGEPDALDVAARLFGQPLQGHGEVRPALRLRHGVDLVDDDPLRAGEQPSRLGGEHEVQRLGVVMRMSGGVRSMAARSRCGVSPVRTATVTSAPMPRSGARRLRSTS